MATAKIKTPDGRTMTLTVPDGATQDEILAFAAQNYQPVASQVNRGPEGSLYDTSQEFAAQQPYETPIEVAPQRSMMDQMRRLYNNVDGVADATTTVASLGAAEIAAGWAGLTGAAIGLDPQATSNIVGKTRNALTREPTTEKGREYLASAGEFVKPAAEVLKGAETYLGDKGYKIAGPTGGAIGATIPTALLEAAGLGVGRLVKNTARTARNFSRATPDEAQQALLTAGKEADVPIMTSDIFPPEGQFGKILQGQFEKLGIFGTGGKRANQQASREKALTGFAESMDIDLDTPFAAGMVASINKTLAQEIKAAADMRERAVTSLDTFGVVGLTNTLSAIDRQIAAQVRLGPKGNKAHIQNLENTRSALEGGDFSLVKDIRTEVISDLKVLEKAEDARTAGSLQQVKLAIDDDLKAFAVANDRGAAVDWVKSNRAFADAYGRAKDTELKRVLMKGDATPEILMPIIRGGKVSELRRMAKSMGPEGRVSAQRAIIQDALKDSKFFQVDQMPNPDAFATALNRPNRQQAIRVFFDGEARAQLDGFTRLLNSTRRAQQGTSSPRTGEQLGVFATGAGGVAVVAADPTVGAAVIATASALIKTYESKAFRTLMLKLSNTKKGSKAESRIMQLATTMAVAGSQNAKEQLQE